MAELDDLAALDDGRLQALIDAARQAYQDARDAVATEIAPLFVHPEAAADALLEVAEEFGAEHAVETLRSDTAAFGDARGDIGGLSQDEAAQALAGTLETVLTARDQLDRLTGEREGRRAKADPAHGRVVNLDGREFATDAGGTGLRSIDSPGEVYPVGRIVPTRELTLTEHMRLEFGAEPAQPAQERTPSRSR